MCSTERTLRQTPRSHWLMAASVSLSPSPFLPGPYLVERQCGWSARGSRPRWSDRWNSEKRKRRRASTHTKQCSPKAKAPRCRRTARHEKSKHRNVNYCVFLSPSKFFPLALCCSLDWLTRSDFLLARIELNEPPCLLAIPSLSRVTAAFTSSLLRSRRPNSRVVWQCFDPSLPQVFCGYSSREQRGDNNNIALPLSTLFSLLRSWGAPVLFPPVLSVYSVLVGF